MYVETTFIDYFGHVGAGEQAKHRADTLAPCRVNWMSVLANTCIDPPKCLSDRLMIASPIFPLSAALVYSALSPGNNNRLFCLIFLLILSAALG